MSLITISIIFLLIFQNLVIAEDNTNQGTEVTWHNSYTIAIVCASVFLTISFTGLAYLILKCIKRKTFKPEYYIDDISIQKDGIEYNNDLYQTPQFNQIQPILSVSQIVLSIKQSLDDLGNIVLPNRWTTPQQVVIQETPIEEKIDLPI